MFFSPHLKRSVVISNKHGNKHGLDLRVARRLKTEDLRKL